MDSRIITEQRRRNDSSRESWTRFHPHRARVMENLLASQRSADGCLGVLGAGNCSDLDLPVLAKHFASVTLVDIDDQALLSAVRQQGVESVSNIELHVADVTGMTEMLSRLSPEMTADEPVLLECLARPNTPALGGPYDAGTQSYRDAAIDRSEQ